MPVRYPSDIDDNRRWLDFPVRDGDVVVSTRSKHGTTWVQQICALLIFGTARLPGPLSELSPWVDWIPEPLPELIERTSAMRHRRLFKTHTPLDGLPLDPRVTYLMVARHPLDGAASLYHQSGNIDRARVAELLGTEPPAPRPPRPPLADWVREWALDDHDPVQWQESPRGVLHHVADAWRRRQAWLADPSLPRVELLHYADLQADLAGRMRDLAQALGMTVPASAWPDLVQAASFGAMRATAQQSAPDPGGALLSRDDFFRGGRSGDGVALLEPSELAALEARMRELAEPEIVDWLLR